MTSSALGDEASSLSGLVEATRQLGSDPRLVLHGGGNSSLKTSVTDLDGSTVEVLWIKGSGHDMGTITEAGFAPLRLARLRQILPPVTVPEEALRNELRCALVDSSAPDPSVEALVHALIPAPAVMHSHADSLLALGAALGREGLAEVLGDHVVIADYAMPGPHLVVSVANAWALADDQTVGVMVQGHGLFTGGQTPAEALERHLEVVARADARLGETRPVTAEPIGPTDAVRLATLRSKICDAAGHPMVVRTTRDERVAAFLSDEGALSSTTEGPLTPDHVIWTKPWPQVGEDFEAFGQRYRDYVERNKRRAPGETIALDPAPRVVLDPEVGMLAAGRTAREAGIVTDIYQHTMDAITNARALGGYTGAGEGHLFDLEYWSYQQEKVRRTDDHAPMAGQVAVVTGAASGIGRGCARAMLDQGCCVVGWDLSPKVVETFDSDRYLGIPLDVTDAEAVSNALRLGVETFGGLDVLVVAAGIFPSSANVGEMDMAQWRRAMSVNVDSVAELYRQAHALLALGRPYGRVVLIASKNVAAPGPGAAAYSSSKAAVTQLTRVAALEWAGEGIRLNMVHPDAVFDTGLWTPELLAARAEHYGMTVDQYKRRNMLHAEVTSTKVGALCVSMCGPAFECTTGAQVPIDGGSDRVI
ncbi:bifunctional aldolase/short-chain dehydrogenase [Acidipropionibacterium timonense]|uniref:bifunctional aldolase/short-chain dehydrogenase n=1 Tax=Acidipropionibacterium timonense TaxID=2161818 RepID=UPI00103087E7|nr:bifunctional aldolase/short-chain dehydrogenase [Acidipropionibacterium timonense]